MGVRDCFENGSGIPVALAAIGAVLIPGAKAPRLVRRARFWQRCASAAARGADLRLIDARRTAARSAENWRSAIGIYCFSCDGVYASWRP